MTDPTDDAVAAVKAALAHIEIPNHVDPFDGSCDACDEAKNTILANAPALLTALEEARGHLVAANRHVEVVDELNLGHLRARLAAEQELTGLRQWLWLNHGCHCALLYGDDGEMQCNDAPAHPGNRFLDFKRDDIASLVVAAMNGAESKIEAAHAVTREALDKAVCLNPEQRDVPRLLVAQVTDLSVERAARLEAEQERDRWQKRWKALKAFAARTPEYAAAYLRMVELEDGGEK